MEKENLINQVIEQIRKDILMNEDLSSLEILLKNLSLEDLNAFLPESEQKEYV